MAWLVIVSNRKTGRVTRHRFDNRMAALHFADQHRARPGRRVEVQVAAAVHRSGRRGSSLRDLPQEG
jgi:hypothetical protein